ncbi:MAG: leucine-rich repeat domain-containing protein [Bacteroidales bacterium]|jgi:hypothetical protein|nr:leucine-rich repeat domain-containing protein [Bacteroidales bacterium]
MKRIFKKLLFLALLAISVNVYSQRILDIYSNGSIVERMITSDIDSIKFVEAEYIVIDSGTTGACTWKIAGIAGMASNYILIISGNGLMGDYNNISVPWYQYRTNIKTLIIEDGVVNIGNYAFSYCSSLTDVTIPGSVIIIGNNAFYYCSSLTDVAIPGSVITIGNNAFYYCNRLTDITIPGSVTTIGDYAFALCYSLTSINVDAANTAYSSADGVLFNKIQTTLITCPAGKIGNYIIPNSVTIISDYAFRDCDSLNSITIPNSVITIGIQAFVNCDGLTSVTIPSSVSTVGDYAFATCRNLTSIDVDAANTVYASINGVMFNKAQTTLIIYPAGKTGSYYTIPNSVTVVYSDAFALCSNLTGVTIPNSVITIDDFAFEYCSSLTSITIPDSVTTIGRGLFRNCGNLNSVTISNSVTTIGYGTFMYCSSLTDITIPNSVTTIDIYAFYNCYNLADVTIGSSVTSIGFLAFHNCTGLTTVINLNPVPQSIDSDVFSNIDLSDCTLKVPAEAVSAYQAAPVWREFFPIVSIAE